MKDAIYFAAVALSGVLWSISGSSSFSSLCPVFDAIVPSDEVYNYPLEIYSPVPVQNISNQFPHAKIFKCFSYDRAKNYPNITENVCSDHKVPCPVKPQFIVDTLNETNARMPYPSLCKISETFHRNASQLRFIIFGGSVTEGVSSDGCNMKNDCINPDRGMNHGCHECAWPHYLERWLKAAIDRNITLHNLALSAHDSPAMAERLNDRFTARNVPKLTKDCVVFLDHGANDYPMHSPIRNNVLDKGLEMLIRKIYAQSEPHSLPTIILLATAFLDFKSIPKAGYYTNNYQKIGAHYNLPVWDFNAFYHSSYIAAANLTYGKYIIRQFNIHDSAHPPWHVNLFTADLLGAMILREMDQCDRLSPTDRDSLMHTHYLNDIAKLPAPLAKHNDSVLCGANKLMSLSYESLVTEKDTAGGQKSNGSWESKPPGEWQLRLDAKGRSGGFIHEFYNFSAPPSNTTSGNPELHFSLPLNRSDFWNHRKPLLITLTIFRTYENAGQVKLQICDGNLAFPNIQNLDALWSDFKTYHYSLPVTYSFQINPGECQAPYNELPVTFSVVPMKYGNSAGKLPRGNEKFKVYAMSACYFSEATARL